MKTVIRKGVCVLPYCDRRRTKRRHYGQWPKYCAFHSDPANRETPEERHRRILAEVERALSPVEG